MENCILPYPKKIRETNKWFSTENCGIILADNIDRRIYLKAAKLRDFLSEMDGTYHRLSIDTVDENGIHIGISEKLQHEEYCLEIAERFINITGGDAAGCFYGLQTLQQIITYYKNKLPAIIVDDFPDMKYRGFYHDATRGRIPNMAGMKKIIDILAKMKINSLQLYVEHTFDFYEFHNLQRSEGYVLTPKDILEIDDYCYENFIDFIPSLSTFGHLYELLNQKEYSELCELEGFKPKWHFWRERMAHHTIDPSNPRSYELICSLIDQYLPLFRSEYFNICCDETMDLCKGKNKGKDQGKLYCEFVNKIINYVTLKGKKVMMWGDIALEHPVALEMLSKDTVLLNWDYAAEPNLEKIEIVGKSGFSQIVCPGTTSWARLIENPEISIPNITKMIECGYKHGVKGVLNTNWGDYGHPASFENSLYGIVTAACKSWNVNMLIDSDFEVSVSSLVYCSKLNVINLITQLSRAQDNAPWVDFFEWNKNRDRTIFTGTVSSCTDAAGICEEAFNAFSIQDTGYEPIQHLKVAARGIALLNSAESIILNNGDFTEWRYSAEEWLNSYEKLWLKTNKPSELCEIRNFIFNISNLY